MKRRDTLLVTASLLVAFLFGRLSTTVLEAPNVWLAVSSVPGDVYLVLLGGLITMFVTGFFNVRQRAREDNQLRSSIASEIEYTLHSLEDVRNSLVHGLSGDIELPTYGTDIALSDDIYLSNTGKIGRLGSDESDVVIRHYVLLKRLRLVLNELEDAVRSSEYDTADVEHVEQAARELTIQVHTTGERAKAVLQSKDDRSRMTFETLSKWAPFRW